MTNEQIDRGIKKSNDILKGTHNIRVKRRMADINEVLEAMKEPEIVEKDFNLSFGPSKYTGPFISAKDLEVYKDIPTENFVEGYKKWEAKKGGGPSEDIKI